MCNHWDRSALSRRERLTFGMKQISTRRSFHLKSERRMHSPAFFFFKSSSKDRCTGQTVSPPPGPGWPSPDRSGDKLDGQVQRAEAVSAHLKPSDPIYQIWDLPLELEETREIFSQEWPKLNQTDVWLLFIGSEPQHFLQSPLAIFPAKVLLWIAKHWSAFLHNET